MVDGVQAVFVLLGQRRRRANPARALGPPAAGRQPDLPGRGAHPHALGIEDERGAVEDQFVLAADQIDVDQRQPALGSARPRQALADLALVELERRAVEHDQQIGAVFGEVAGDVRRPHVLADHHAQAQIAERHRLGQRAGAEHPLLVEHAVVRQIVLPAHRLDAAVLEQQGGVVEGAGMAPGRAQQQRRPAVAGLRRQRFRRRLDALLKRPLQHQILGRVAGQRQLAADDEVAGAGAQTCRTDALDVAVDVAHHRIDLRESHRQRRAHRSKAHEKIKIRAT